MRPQRHVARGAKPGSPAKEVEGTGPVSQVRDAVTAQAEEALALLQDPGKMARFEEMALEQLPYHPEFLLREPSTTSSSLRRLPLAVSSRSGCASWLCPGAGQRADSEADTTIDSATTPRGTAIGAVLTEPVFSRDHQVILPQKARHWQVR